MAKKLSHSKTAYKQVLTGALKQFVTEQLDQPPETQFNLAEELAIFRATCQTAVRAFDVAIQKNDASEVLAVGGVVRKQLLQVGQLASMAARVNATNSEQMTKAAVESIISGIIDIIFSVLQEEPNGLQLAVKIEKHIQDRISLTVDRGTITLPSDEIVNLMDDTVPRLEN